MKFLTVNGKIQFRNGKAITVPDDYNNSLIKIGNNLVKTSAGLIGKKPEPGLYDNSADKQLVKSWEQLVSSGSLIITSGVLKLQGSLYPGWNLVIAETVTGIADYGFNGETNLASVKIPETVTSIGAWAFNSCSVLKKVNIPKAVINIGEYTFNNCSCLMNISIPEAVTSIGERAFRNCIAFTDINIPEAVTSIGDQAFAYCQKLISINYAGTKAQWNAITKGSDWDIGTGSYTIHCTDGDIAKS